MRAVVLHDVGDVRVTEVPDPVIREPGDAIVEVTATALCGADLFPFHGYTPGFENGTVLGHEFVGVVREVGSDVASFRAGQRVVNASMVRDGSCPSCRAGRPTQCDGRALFGYSGVYPRLDGGQAELVRIPNADLSLGALPDAVSDEAGVFLADILPTGYGAVTRAGVAAGDLVAVLGCGPLGLMSILCALHAGATVIAVDAVDARRDLAATLGATSFAPDDALEAVKGASGGLGADVVIEAAGSSSALDASLALARGRGTISVVGAHFEPDYPLNNLLMFEHELTLRFTIGDPSNDRGGLLDLIASDAIDPTRTITHRMDLADAAEAYRLFDAREATKVVLTT